jgi:tetratricopeptide (TPR) repeat protein
VDNLDAALKVRPSKEARWLRATAHLRLDQRPLALADLDAVIKIDPRDALAHFQRGLLLMKEKDYRNARKSLDEAFRLDPSLADAADPEPKEPKR